MVRIIMHGCNGRMGQMITGLVAEDSEATIVAGIDWYSEGDCRWSGDNKSDEKGCVGCPWYDLADWKEKFNKILKEIGY